jgi:hypothetical protein
MYAYANINAIQSRHTASLQKFALIKYRPYTVRFCARPREHVNPIPSLVYIFKTDLGSVKR